MMDTPAAPDVKDPETGGGTGVEECRSNAGEGTADHRDGVIVSNMVHGGTGVEKSGSDDREGTNDHRDGIFCQ